MANYTTFFPGGVIPQLGYNASLGATLVLSGHTVIFSDDTQQVLQLTNGLKVKLLGTGLTYDAQGNGTGGTLASIEVYQNDGTTLAQTLTGIDRSFHDFYNAAS